MDNSRPRKISLAAALWGLPPADDRYAPNEQAPASWQEGFVSQPGVAPVIRCVAQTGKAGQQWALRQAPNAKWYLYCYRPCGEQELSRLLAAAARALALRGGRRTRVKLYYDHGPATDAALAALPQGLSGAGAAVTELELTLGTVDAIVAQAASDAAAHFVHNVAPSVFPNLTSIHFGQAVYPLAAPSHMPHLHIITASSSGRDRDTALAFIDSVALYMPQLSSLKLGHYESNDVAAVWGRLFCPASTSHTLTHFDTANSLTDDLLDLLLTHAPALTHLDVSSLDSGLGDHSGKEWDVGCVRVFLLTWQGEGTSALAKLPKLRAGGRVVVRTGDDMKPRLSLTAQGLRPRLAARLADYKFEVGVLRLRPVKTGISPDQQPQALRIALQQLSALQTAPNTVVRLEGLQWSDTLAAAVHDLAPTLPHVRLGIYMDVLTDEQLGTALRAGPHVHVLDVAGLSLTTSNHADKAWVWQRVLVAEKNQVDMAQLLRLPVPGAGGPQLPVVCIAGTWKVDISEAESARLCQLLPRFRIGIETPSPGWLHRFLVRGQPSELHGNIAVLRAIHFTSPTEQVEDVRLKIEGLTTSGISALQTLPVWGGDLRLRFTQWSLQPDEARALGTHIPTSYTQLHLLGCTDEDVVHGVCDGLNARREGLGLDPVVVLYYGVGPEDGVDPYDFSGGGWVTRGKHVTLRKMRPEREYVFDEARRHYPESDSENE